MKLEIMAIRDSKAEVFSQPMFFQAVGQAVRAFSDAINDDKSDFSKHPEDYSLFHVGSFDDNLGTVIPLATGPVVLGNGSTFVIARVPSPQLSLMDGR